MQTFLWFCIILFLTLLYGMRIKRVVGFVQSPLVHWYVAVTLGGGLFIGALLVTKTEVVVHHDVTVALHGVMMFVGGWLGLRYWFSWRLWDAPAAVLALVLVAFYFTDRQEYNNVMFSAVVLGASVGGYYVTKRWLLAFTAIMACFDAYAVWASNVMEQLIDQDAGPFPSELFIASLLPTHFSIGVMDALMAGLVTVGIVHHRGALRAAGFVASLASTVLFIGLLVEPFAMRGITFFTKVPLLVALAPLAWYFLITKRHQNPSP